MSPTVFYSWQSDLPNSTNRGFIERAIKDAIATLASDLSLVEAVRELSLDKDTQGVPGSPPIVDSILGKISNCGIFVPDVSFVGSSTGGRLLPNPNVLIEYGWALNSAGHSRMVPVMNTAYGTPDGENLPFDMRHQRRPICYSVEEGCSAEDKRRAREALTQAFAQAFRAIITAGILSLKPAEPFIEIPPKNDPAQFWEDEESVELPDSIGSENLRFPAGPRLFLRVIPTKQIEPLSSSRMAYQAIVNSNVRPFIHGSCGYTPNRDRYGAFVAHHDADEVKGVTQLFLNKEIWGVDLVSLGFSKTHDRGSPFFPCTAVEELFRQMLDQYRDLATKALGVPLPLKVIAGATNVQGFKMCAPRGMGFNGGIDQFGGKVLVDHIVKELILEDTEISSGEVLLPFFVYLWEECGLERPTIKAN